jgi:Mg/Co/Ni transporter MgtE
MTDGRIALSQRLAETHPDTAASVLESQPVEAAAAFLDSIPARAAGPVLARMLPFRAARCLRGISRDQAVALLCEMPAAVAAGIMRQSTRSEREALIAGLPERRARAIRLLTGYPQNTVGACMNPQPPLLPAGLTVAEAIERLREEAENLDRVIHVIDREQQLLGRVRSAELLRADPQGMLDALIEAAPFTVHARTDLISCRDLPAWEQTDTLPVLTRDSRFVGVLHHAGLRRGLVLARATAPTLPGDRTLDLVDQYWLGMARFVEGLTALLPSSRGKSSVIERSS